MKKNYFLLIILLLLFWTLRTQRSTEQFEAESNGSTSFTDDGVIFNVVFNVNTNIGFMSGHGLSAFRLKEGRQLMNL